MLSVNRHSNLPDAEPSQGASRATSVLPRPTLVGLSAKAAPQPKVEVQVEAKTGPQPKGEPTLRGVVPKGSPLGLAPLAACKPAPKKKSESSLVGLSLKVERSRISRSHSTIEAPAAPPGVRKSFTNLRNKRHAAEPTDHNVEIVDAHAPTVDLSNRDDLWEKVAADQSQRGKRRAILTVVALLSMLAVFAVAPRIPTRSSASAGENAKLDVPQPRAEVPAAMEEAQQAAVPEAAISPEAAPALQEATPALKADMLAPASAAPHAKAKVSGHSKHRRSHAHRRAHKRRAAR